MNKKKYFLWILKNVELVLMVHNLLRIVIFAEFLIFTIVLEIKFTIKRLNYVSVLLDYQILMGKTVSDVIYQIIGIQKLKNANLAHLDNFIQ